MKYSIQKEKFHLHSCSTMFLTTKICSIILLPCLSPGNFESTPCPTICNNKHKKRYPVSFHISRYLLFGESWSHTSLKQWCGVSVNAVMSASRSSTCMPSTQDLCALISHALDWVCSAFARSVLYTSVIPILRLSTTCWPCALLCQFS